MKRIQIEEDDFKIKKKMIIIYKMKKNYDTFKCVLF